MQSVLSAKEQLSADTPLFFFDCMMADGRMQHWSSRAVIWNGTQYAGRVVRHNLFEAQLASDTQIGGAPKLTFELANADSHLSEIEQQTGFKGAQLTVRAVFFDLASGAATTDATVVFRGLMNPPDTITENIFRLSAMNRISMQRTVVPNIRVSRMCPWRFPATEANRLEAVDGGAAHGKYSLFYRCGYSPDQTNGVGNLNGDIPFTSCSYSRSDCEQRGMFSIDSSRRTTSRFGGIEYVPPTILVRGAGQKHSQLSAVQENTASYNDFVPLIYGTQWHVPDVVFSRNDGNLTRMEVLLGMGQIEGVLSVLVNDIQIPQGVSGVNMTSTGWYNIVSAGSRDGRQDPNFSDGHGNLIGDPYGSMAYLSVVVPNRINDGTSIPAIQALVRGLKLWQFDIGGNLLGEHFSSNPAWVLLDILMRCGYGLNEINTASFAKAAAYADELIWVDDALGSHVQLPRFQCNFALKSSQSAGEVIRSIKNASQVYLVLNSDGLLEARIENTFALQHPLRPEGSNAVAQFNGGWPAYEFDAGSIARAGDGSASVRLSRKGAQDSPNRLSIEFQDSFNQYQQDSLSLVDEDDVNLCGQEIAVHWDGVGISTFSQASRVLLLGLNTSISGNLFIEFQTSVKALGLMPGDLITVSYSKENLLRTPFRITKVVPGVSYRTATITARLHDDAWYSDAPTGITGGRGTQTGRGCGLPAPVAGTVVDSNNQLQLGITESEVTTSGGQVNIELEVSFTAPSGRIGTLPAPLIGLAPTVGGEGGTLAGGNNYFYALSAVDPDGGESSLSFTAQATTPPGGDTNSVILDGIVLPIGAASFHVYRGTNPELQFRIASDQISAPVFTDTGFPPLAVVPPDRQFDHVNLYWRWELLPETPVNIHSAISVGNPQLRLVANQYRSATILITKGKGAGQERAIAGNTGTEFTVESAWTTEPDATSSFVIAENSWRFGALGDTAPIAIDVPERIGSGVEIVARAANAANVEADYALSPLTRWILGQSGGLASDFDVPPAPEFGLAVSLSRGGAVSLGAIGFTSLVNSAGIVAGTYTFHYYDEILGAAPISLTNALESEDTVFAFGSPFPAGTRLQIEQEIVRVTGSNDDGSSVVVRGADSTVPAPHLTGAIAYPLSDRVLIVPFVRNFFGTQVSGDWEYTIEMPNVRIASAELFMTNALGAGAIAVNSFTATIDGGLRTMNGGQFSFQVSGYLAIQTGAAPPIIVDADRSVRDLYAIVGSPAFGADLVLQVKRNSDPYATLTFTRGATSLLPGAITSDVVGGFGLPALAAGDRLTLDVTGVGTVTPGSDLTVIMRL